MSTDRDILLASWEERHEIPDFCSMELWEELEVELEAERGRRRPPELPPRYEKGDQVTVFIGGATFRATIMFIYPGGRTLMVNTIMGPDKVSVDDIIPA